MLSVAGLVDGKVVFTLLLSDPWWLLFLLEVDPLLGVDSCCLNITAAWA